MEQTFVVARMVFLLDQTEPPALPAEHQRQSVQTLTDLVMKSDRSRHLSLERRR